ncbi:MAG: sulfatase-like hydrolase/transferase [Lachnospiraceae bacterium]|nr:sulfatase-like hydrolase/transferase [Lachnospiraceae bacterium]
MKNTKFIKKIGIAFLPCLLLSFMVLWFGPSEIFFSNVSQFEFKYGEFVWLSVGLMVAISLVVSLIMSLLPKKVYYVLTSLIFSIGVLGYIQVMFLNQNLDLLGQNPDGYSASVGLLIINTIIWLAVIGLFVFLGIKKSELVAKISMAGSIILILMQGAGLVSLILGAGEEAYKRPENSWFLSGEEQMVVSSNENVIVIVLDYFSNEYLDATLEKYPDAIDFLHDFTYYNNDDCTYFGTFPSMLHMLTGAHVDNTVAINEWTKSVLEDSNYKGIFDTMHKKGYKVNVFTPSSDIYRANNDITILNGLFDNMANSATIVEVNQSLLIKTVSKMSSYRMAPEILKNLFYTTVSEYEDIVTDVNASRAHNNYDFLDRLNTEGVNTKSDSKYFIIQHLMGDHDRATNADGTHNESEDASLEDNSKGCMVIVEEYLEQLKANGAYDNSTIIITSDHGSPTEPQVIFFMKMADETHDEMKTTDAPISHCDLLPTIIDAMGADGHKYGTPVTDYDSGDRRDRIFWICQYDEEFPYIQIFTGDKEGMANCMYGYFYNGDYKKLKEKLNGKPDAKLPLVDTFF